MQPYPCRAPYNNRIPLGVMIGQLAGDLARLAFSVPQGGLAIAQDIVGGLVWRGEGVHCYPRHPCASGNHYGCHRYMVACYPRLPQGGCDRCGHC
jgi:hypothetical protein